MLRWEMFSLGTGLGRAFFQRSINCGRWILTKLGPSDIRPPIMTQATSSWQLEMRRSELPADLSKAVACESTLAYTSTEP